MERGPGWWSIRWMDGLWICRNDFRSIDGWKALLLLRRSAMTPTRGWQRLGEGCWPRWMVVDSSTPLLYPVCPFFPKPTGLVMRWQRQLPLQGGMDHL